MSVELLHGDLNGPLELRIVTLAHELGVLPHGHIRTDTVILDGESAVQALYRYPRCGDAAAIHERRIAVDADESTPGALAHERADMVHLEVPRQGIPSGACELVDDHDLGSEDRLRRPDLRASPTRHDQGHRPPLQVIDDVIGNRAAVIEALIDHDALPVHLREEIPVEIDVPARCGVG